MKRSPVIVFPQGGRKPRGAFKGRAGPGSETDQPRSPAASGRSIDSERRPGAGDTDTLNESS